MSELLDALPPTLAKPVNTLLKVKNFVIVLAGFVMALTFGFVVVLRYGFNADLFAYEEWLMVICFWMFFMGSAVGTYENSHIKADLLGILLSAPKVIWFRSVLVCVLELIITLAIVYWAGLMLVDEVSYYPNWQSTIALHIPFLVPRVGIFLGFVFMAFYSALHLWVLLHSGVPDRRKDNQLIPRQRGDEGVK